MIEAWKVRLFSAGIALAAFSCESTIATSRAERVGYAFQGALTPPPFGSTYKLFGVTVPNTWPIAGTFSFDTTAIGVDSQRISGAKEFKQSIHGGFTWNILDGTTHLPVLQLAAHEYFITVANNYFDGTSFIDYIRIDVASNVPPVWVNGSPYTGSTALVTVGLSWDASAFDDFDDPKLRAALPVASLMPTIGAARSGSPAAFTTTSLSRISLTAGDLNLDGRTGVSDYIEWRKAFAGTLPDLAFADANADGVIDAADYVVWRKATAIGTAAGNQIVPEPSIAVPAVIAVIHLSGNRRRRLRWRVVI